MEVEDVYVDHLQYPLHVRPDFEHGLVRRQEIELLADLLRTCSRRSSERACKVARHLQKKFHWALESR